MADEADAASENTQREINARIKASQDSLMRRELTPSGQCYCCRYPIGDFKIFCDSGCAEDYHAFNSNRRMR